MSFKKTACLASLLLSFPLAAPNVSVAANWDKHPDILKITGTAQSSGESKDNPYISSPDAATYEKIYIGHAERLGTDAGKAEANYNKGILGSGVTVTQYVYGGSATTSQHRGDCDGIALEANGNTIIMESGSSVDGASHYLPALYGGYAQSVTINTGTAVASDNIVTIETGASLKADDGYTNLIYGGYAKLSYANGASSAATASGNSVTIEEGVSLPAFQIFAGWAGGVAGEVTANGNTATLTSLDSGDSITSVAGGRVEGFDSIILDDSTARVHANGNTVTIASSKMYEVRGGWAEGGAYAESNENTLAMTGGEAYEVYAGHACIKNYGEADSQKITKAWKNTLTLQNTVAVTAYGGYAEAVNSDENADTAVSKKEAYATENTLIMNGGSYREAAAGYAESDNIAKATGNYLYLNYDPEQGKSLETETKLPMRRRFATPLSMKHPTGLSSTI